MSRQSDQELKEFLYKALESTIGIRVETDDPQRLIQKLHAARRNTKDEALGVLVIAISRTSPDKEVWIVKQPKGEGAPNAEEK